MDCGPNKRVQPENQVMNSLEHPDNNHWQEWRDAVQRTGYNFTLARASRVLREISDMTPQCFESVTANLYRNMK
jgi:hypothetical protein